MRRWTTTALARALALAALLAALEATAQSPEPGRLDPDRYRVVMPRLSVEDGRRFQEAESRFRDQRFAEALPLYREAAAFRGMEAARSYAEWMAAMCLLHLDRTDEARAEFRRIIEAHPDTPERCLADYALGVALRWEEAFEEARAHFEGFVEDRARSTLPDWRERAVDWLLDQYQRLLHSREDEAVRARWLTRMWERAEARPQGREAGDLERFLTGRSDWQALGRLWTLRHGSDEAAWRVTQGRLREVIARGTDPTRRADLTADGVRAVLRETDSVPEFLRTEDRERTLALLRMQAATLVGLREASSDIIRAWMSEHPRDETALLAYLGFLDERTIDPGLTTALVRGVVGGPRNDLVLGAFARVAAQGFEALAPAVGLLRDLNAPPSAWFALYRDRDPERAEPHARAAFEADPSPAAGKELAGWLGDRAFASSRWADADLWLGRALELEDDPGRHRSTVERWRDQRGQAIQAVGDDARAADILAPNRRARSPLHRARARLAHARSTFAEADVRERRSLETELREVLGQNVRQNQLDIRWADDPDLRAIQEQVVPFLRDHDIEPTRPPAWR